MTCQRIIFFLCICAFVVSCHKAPPRIAGGGTRSVNAIVAERSIKESEDRVKTLRGLAHAVLAEKDEGHETDIAVVIDRPGHIRIDAFDNLADVWAAAGSDGSRLWLWLPQKKKLYQGKATSRNLRRLADFDWELTDVISIAAGLVPNARGAELAHLEKEVYNFRDRPMRLWMDAKERHPLRLVRYYLPEGNETAANEQIQYDVKFSDYRTVGGIDFPHKIEVTFPGRSCSLTLDWKDVEFNVNVKQSLFKPEALWQGKKVEMDQ